LTWVCIESEFFAMKLQYDLQFFTSILFICFVTLLFRLYNSFVKKPNVVRSKLRKQRISGPPPTILLGNLMDIIKSQLSTPNSPSFEPPLTHKSQHCFSYLSQVWRMEGTIWYVIQSYKLLLHIWYRVYFLQVGEMTKNF